MGSSDENKGHARPAYSLYLARDRISNGLLIICYRIVMTLSFHVKEVARNIRVLVLLDLLVSVLRPNHRNLPM